MSYAQADLDNLDRMIASGILSAFYDGKKIEYRSMDDLRAARSIVAKALASAAAVAVSPSYTPTYSKGC